MKKKRKCINGKGNLNLGLYDETPGFRESMVCWKPIQRLFCQIKVIHCTAVLLANIASRARCNSGLLKPQVFTPGDGGPSLLQPLFPVSPWFSSCVPQPHTNDFYSLHCLNACPKEQVEETFSLRAHPPRGTCILAHWPVSCIPCTLPEDRGLAVLAGWTKSSCLVSLRGRPGAYSHCKC